MIKIGGEIGAFNTILLIFLTAFIGVYYARIQGIHTLKSGIVNLYQNKMPIYELISGASIALAAILLIIPGFVTDIVGFLLLFPFARNFLFKMTFRKKTIIKEDTKTDNAIDGEIIDNNKKDNNEP